MSSVLNVMMADDVTRLLDEVDKWGTSDPHRTMPREQAYAVIHAALWAYSNRAGSTAGAYAWAALHDALKPTNTDEAGVTIK